MPSRATDRRMRADVRSDADAPIDRNAAHDRRRAHGASAGRAVRSLPRACGRRHRAPPARLDRSRRGRPSASCAFVITLFLSRRWSTLVITLQRGPLRPDLRATTRPPAATWAPTCGRRRSCATTCCPNLQLSGWSMDWYGGFPLYRFYMVIPALAIVALDVVLPVRRRVQDRRRRRASSRSRSAAGRSVASPRFRHPIPELFAFAGLLLPARRELRDLRRQREVDDGGRVLVLDRARRSAMLGLGLLANGSGAPASTACWTAVVLVARRAVSHGIVLIFVAVGARRCCALVWIDRMRLVLRASPPGSPTVLLSAWWVGAVPVRPRVHDRHEVRVPAERARATRSGTCSSRSPRRSTSSSPRFAVDRVRRDASLRRHLTGTCDRADLHSRSSAGVYVTRDSLPGDRSAVEPAAAAVRLPHPLPADDGRHRSRWSTLGGQRRARRRRATLRRAHVDEGRPSVAGRRSAVDACSCSAGCTTVAAGCDGSRRTTARRRSYAWGPFAQRRRRPADARRPTGGRATTSAATRASPRIGEYNDARRRRWTTSAPIRDGCGRALWENNGDNGEYGTTMALMLLPHWTDGCIGSRWRACSSRRRAPRRTTSSPPRRCRESSSNPVRQLRYDEQRRGASACRTCTTSASATCMVRTEAAKSRGRRCSPSSTFVRQCGPWDIYEVAGQRHRRAARPCSRSWSTSVDGDQRERNLELGTSWFQHRDEWAAMPADDGPDDVAAGSTVVDRPRPARQDDRGRHRRCPTEPIDAVDAAGGHRERRRDRRRRTVQLRRRPDRCAGARAR